MCMYPLFGAIKLLININPILVTGQREECLLVRGLVDVLYSNTGGLWRFMF